MKFYHHLKKHQSYFLFALCIFMFFSCQMTEKLTVSENGSGKISFEVDGSSFMQMMGSKINKDGKLTKYDSIIHFKDVLKEKQDSIKKLPLEQQLRIKKLESFSLQTKMDSEARTMSFNMFSEFKDVDELSNMLNSFQDGFNLASKSNKKLQGQQSKMLKKPSQPTSKVTYKYTKTTFERSTKILDAAKLKKETDSLESAKFMLASSKYKLIYQFPKRIKKASIDNAYFSADGKTITIETGLIDYLTDPKLLDFSVEFEK